MPEKDFYSLQFPASFSQFFRNSHSVDLIVFVQPPHQADALFIIKRPRESHADSFQFFFWEAPAKIRNDVAEIFKDRIRIFPGFRLKVSDATQQSPGDIENASLNFCSADVQHDKDRHGFSPLFCISSQNSFIFCLAAAEGIVNLFSFFHIQDITELIETAQINFKVCFPEVVHGPGVNF